jgi:hypothetical protein
MSDLNLSNEERAIVEAMARDRHSAGSRLGFYASVLVPVLLFAVYGFTQRDFITEAIALFGLLLFVGWRLSQEFTRLGAYKSLCKKIVEHEGVERNLTRVRADAP